MVNVSAVARSTLLSGSVAFPVHMHLNVLLSTSFFPISASPVANPLSSVPTCVYYIGSQLYLAFEVDSSTLTSLKI